MPDTRKTHVHIGSITHRPLDTTTLPTSVRLADAMTITGIDSTGQSPGGNVLPPRPAAGAQDLDAELRALETDVAAAPISVIPAGRPATEEESEQAPSYGIRRSLTWRDIFAILSFVAIA